MRKLGVKADSARSMTCGADFMPIRMVTPKMPTCMSRYFLEGDAVISIKIDRAGFVWDATVISATWRDRKLSVREIARYEDPIIEAILQWTFPVRAVGCTRETRFIMGGE